MSDKKIPDEMKEQLEDSDEDSNGDLDNTEHELDDENLDLLDPQLVEKIKEYGHEDMLVELDGSKGATEDDRMELAREWFSPENEYKADTNFTPKQVYATTLLRNIDGLFENLELEDTQSWVDSVIDDLEKYAISIDGLARKQEENVLRAMFGDTGELSPDEKAGVFARMISNPPGGENED